METKPIWKSKTFWVNVAVALAPLVAYLVANPAALQPYMTPAHFVTYTFALGVVNIGLRFLTTTGVTLFSSTAAP